MSHMYKDNNNDNYKVEYLSMLSVANLDSNLSTSSPKIQNNPILDSGALRLTLNNLAHFNATLDE